MATERAKDATVTCVRSHYLLAVEANIEELAGVRGHVRIDLVILPLLATARDACSAIHHPRVGDHLLSALGHGLRLDLLCRQDDRPQIRSRRL